MRSLLLVRALAVLAAIAGCVPVTTGAPPPEIRQQNTEPPPVSAPEPPAPEPEPELATPVVGVMLPMSGSPVMRQYSELIEEGVRAAVASAPESSGLPIVRVIDSGGGLDEAPGALAELEASACQRSWAAAGGRVARVGEGAAVPVPLIAPAAGNCPMVRRASIRWPGRIRPRESARRAGLGGGIGAFRDRSLDPVRALRSRDLQRGLPRGRRHSRGAFYYPPGQLDFRAEVAELTRIDPDGVLLPLPPLPAMDIPQVAGQVQHYGLDDSLKVEVLGTAGWSTPEVLRDVDVNFTEGVFTVTARPPGRADAAYEEFVRAYETVHRKSLRSDVPALGWDIMGLLLAAFRTGARTPEEVRAALEEIDAFEGATGTLAVEDGRITRVYEVVVIRDRELVRVY